MSMCLTDGGGRTGGQSKFREGERCGIRTGKERATTSGLDRRSEGLIQYISVSDSHFSLCTPSRQLWLEFFVLVFF